ncbi:helix-turn-helix domain-containing protein [Arcobacter cloacae]
MPLMAQLNKGFKMTRLELIQKIENRKKQINISIENLARLSNLGVRTVNRFFAGDDVKLSTIERITNLLGLDFAGNEVVPLNQLEKQRAKEKALFMASLVQSTSALEVQGLEEDSLNKIIDKFEKEFLQGQYKNRLWVA